MSREDEQKLATLPKRKLLELIALEKSRYGKEAKRMVHILCNALAIQEGIIDREFGKEVSDTFGRKLRRVPDGPMHDKFDDNSTP